MLTFCKKLYHLTTSAMSFFISLLSCLLFSSFSAAGKIKKLRKKLNGKFKECYIMGNGPALNDILQSPMANREEVALFAVNFFALNEKFLQVKPDCYMMIDPVLWRNENNNTSNEKKKQEVRSNVKRLLEQLEKVDWDMYFFISNRCPLSLFKNVSPHVHVVQINTTPVSGWKWASHLLYNLGLGMPLPQNVTNAAIFAAIFLRFEKIYLYGANHSWMLDLRVDEQNRIYTEDSHFYKASENRYYFQKGILEKHLRCYANAFASHTALDEYSRTVGVRVYNRTRGSFIDAYEFDAQQ